MFEVTEIQQTTKNNMITLKQILKFLDMIQGAEDVRIWINDFLNMQTENGKLFQHCLDSKLIETYSDHNPDPGTYAETYAQLSPLGVDLYDLGRGN